MQNRRPSRPQGSPEKPERGKTRTQSQTRQRAPHEHERDESADSQASSEPSGQRMGQAAREDLERGVIDSDKGPVLNETYERVREGTPDPVKKFGP